MKKYLYLVASAIGFMLAIVACSGGSSSNTAATACTANAAGCVYSQQYGWLSQGSCQPGYVQIPYGTAGYPTGYTQPGYTTPYGYNQNCVPASQFGGYNTGYGYQNGYYGGYYNQGLCPAGQALVNGQCALVNTGLISTPYYNMPVTGYYYGGYGYGGSRCRTFWGGLGWYCM